MMYTRKNKSAAKQRIWITMHTNREAPSVENEVMHGHTRVTMKDLQMLQSVLNGSRLAVIGLYKQNTSHFLANVYQECFIINSIWQE